MTKKEFINGCPIVDEKSTLQVNLTNDNEISEILEEQKDIDTKLEINHEAINLLIEYNSKIDTLSKEDVCYLMGKLGYSNKQIKLSKEYYEDDTPNGGDEWKEAVRMFKNLTGDVFDGSVSLLKKSFLNINKLSSKMLAMFTDRQDNLIKLKLDMDKIGSLDIIINEKTTDFVRENFFAFLCFNNGVISISDILDFGNNERLIADVMKALDNVCKFRKDLPTVGDMVSELTSNINAHGKFQPSMLARIEKEFDNPIMVTSVNKNVLTFFHIEEKEHGFNPEIGTLTLPKSNMGVGFKEINDKAKVARAIKELINKSNGFKSYVNTIEHINKDAADSVNQMEKSIKNAIDIEDKNERRQKEKTLDLTLQSLKLIGTRIITSCINNYYTNLNNCIRIIELLLNSSMKK